MAGKQGATLFERFLLIVFGLAMVLIGSNTFTEKHGGTRRYLETKARTMKGYIGSLEQKVSRARLKAGIGEEENKAKPQKNPTAKKTN